MSYRNITVDGIGYQYTIGKGCVKIRGLGVWDKEDIGIRVDREFEGDDFGTIEVYPSHIAAKIRETINIKDAT